jgi:hypothetical protein
VIKLIFKIVAAHDFNKVVIGFFLIVIWQIVQGQIIMFTIGINALDTEIGAGVVVKFLGELLDALVGVEGKVGELVSEFGVFLF